jgi:hypothetical protein
MAAAMEERDLGYITLTLALSDSIDYNDLLSN